MENHVSYRLYRDFYSRDFPAIPVTMLVWSRLANNESHFAWKTVRSVEEEHRAEEEITIEIAANQMAEMWLAEQRFQPAAVSWRTTVLYLNSNNERRKRHLPCEIRTGNCSERIRISTETVGSVDRRFFNAHPLPQKLCFWSLPLRYLFMSHQSRPILMSTRDLLLVVLSRQVPEGRSTNFLHELPHHSTPSHLPTYLTVLHFGNTLSNV